MNGNLREIILWIVAGAVLGMIAWNFTTLQQISVEVAVIHQRQDDVRDKLKIIEEDEKKNEELIQKRNNESRSKNG